MTTLSTSIVLLDDPNSLNDINIKSKWILNYLNLRLIITLILLEQMVHQMALFVKGHGWWLLFSFIVILLLFLLLFCLLFLLTTTFFLNFGQLYFNWNSVIFLEIARYWNLNDRWIILKIEQELIHVDIDRVGSWVQLDQLLLHLANTSDSALQSLLDEVSLLWVHDLIVALFEFPVDINVLDVQDTEMH